MRTLLNYSRLPKRQLDSIPFHSIQVESIRFDLIPFESNTLSQYQWLIYESMHKQRTRVVYVFPAPLYYIIDICVLVFVLHWIKLNQHLIKCTENKATAISMGMRRRWKGWLGGRKRFRWLCKSIEQRDKNAYFFLPSHFVFADKSKSFFGIIFRFSCLVPSERFFYFYFFFLRFLLAAFTGNVFYIITLSIAVCLAFHSIPFYFISFYFILFFR